MNILTHFDFSLCFLSTNISQADFKQSKVPLVKQKTLTQTFFVCILFENPARPFIFSIQNECCLSTVRPPDNTREFMWWGGGGVNKIQRCSYAMVKEPFS